MRKISLVAAIALMLAGVGVWATSTTQAPIDVPAGAQINPLQITMGARHLTGGIREEAQINKELPIEECAN
jgi:hypothetical protein